MYLLCDAVLELRVARKHLLYFLCHVLTASTIVTLCNWFLHNAETHRWTTVARIRCTVETTVPEPGGV